MATSKQPPFPDPALEVGVPQYPTPLIPDFYTKNGHIILVEKVSAEKGSYNPQNLDGSVVYTGRDANKWPANLYLVAEQPEPTGKFVFRIWANDRTLASQDPWNYGIAYSLNHPDYKIVTRTYITPREDYTPVVLGSVDPVFGGNAIIAQQQMVELPDDNPLRSRYVQVQRVYETIPSSIITGKRVTERGDIETLDTQVVVAGTAPDADGLLVTQTAIEPIDAVKSKRTKGSVTSYSTLTTKSARSGLLGTTSTTDAIVSPATNPDNVSLSVIESSVEAISATKSKKRTTTSSGPTELAGKSIGEYGYISTQESIAAYNAALPTPTASTVRLDKSPMDTAKAKVSNYSYDSINTLTSYDYDADLDVTLETTRTLIDASTAAYTPVDGDLGYQDKAIDVWKSVRIITSIKDPYSATNPIRARTEYTSGTYSTPNLVTAFTSTQLTFPDGSIQFNVTPVMRAKRSYVTTYLTKTSFVYGQYNSPVNGERGLEEPYFYTTSGEPGGEPSYQIFDPEPVNLNYDGYFINLSIPDCVTVPNLTVTFNTSSAGANVVARYGTLTESYTAPVTAVQSVGGTGVVGYIGNQGVIGTFQRISVEIDYWKANIWRIVEKSVFIK
jgi:hypothetical protein